MITLTFWCQDVKRKRSKLQEKLGEHAADARAKRTLRDVSRDGLRTPGVLTPGTPGNFVPEA